MPPKRTQSEAHLAAARHWAKKAKIQEQPCSMQQQRDHDEDNDVQHNEGNAENPIELSDEEDTRGTQFTPTETRAAQTSCIRLLADRSHELSNAASSSDTNRDTLTLDDLIGMRDLKRTYQFNFAVDIEFFLTHLHQDSVARRVPITFVTGSQVLDQLDDAGFVKSKFDIEDVRAHLPYQFGSHHSKMMVNFYQDDTMEFVIMTCNFNKIDFAGLTQMCWRSGRLARRGSDYRETVLGKRFLDDMSSYLQSYASTSVSDLARTIGQYDYSPINIEILSSAPGKYDLRNEDAQQQGFGRLLSLLKRNKLLAGGSNDKHFNVLAQVSSIASAYASNKGRKSSVLTHLLCPLMFSNNNDAHDKIDVLAPGPESCRRHQTINNYTPHIVFPTANEVAQSNLGYMSGVALHFNNTNAQSNANYKQNVEPYLCSWNSTDASRKTGREAVMPHTKFYACDNGDDWHSLRWVAVGSHNLSKQAWGDILAGGSEYRIASYELSVFIPMNVEEDRKIIPVYGQDRLDSDHHNIPVRFPFRLPPKKYSRHDQPWCNKSSYKQRDRFNNTYP